MEVHIKWKLQNNVHQCAVPRCKHRIGPTYLGLDICWRCYGKHCDKPFLQRYTRGRFSNRYVAGLYFRGWPALVRTREMGIIKLGDKIKMDPENSGAYSQFLKKGDGTIIGIHPLSPKFKDLDRTVQKWPLERVGHLTVRCDNGLVIIIGPSRIAEINGYKRPDLRDEEAPAAVKRRPGPTIGVRVKKRLPRKPSKKAAKKRVPRRGGSFRGLWG
jgi:hypothetical protein